jgi:hypothetical protein
MTNVIRLDAAAVTLLFPKDSTHRVEVTNAVAAEVIKKLFSRDITQKVEDTILGQEKLSKLIHQQAVRLYGCESYDQRNDSITERTKTMIRVGVQEEVRTCIASSFTSHITAQVSAAIERANRGDYLQKIVERELNHGLDVMVRKLVKDKLASLNVSDLF